MQATAEKYIRNKKLNNAIFRGRTAVAFLAALFIVIGVFWWLKIVGITMAGEASCGITEHTHSAECTFGTLICEEIEANGHTHYLSCYDITYTCGLTEHTHVATCYSSSDIDVETSRVWEASLAGVDMGYNFADNFVAIAESQLGYTESTQNFTLNESGGKQGYTRYGEWYGNPYGDWNAMFIDFCLYYTGVYSEHLPYYSGVETMRLEWDALGIYRTVEEYSICKGDIVFFDTDADGRADKAGIVSEVSDDSYYVIIGDYEDAVDEVLIDREDQTILGAVPNVEILRRTASEHDLWRVEDVTAIIDALTPIEIISERLYEYEANGDMDGYSEYMASMAQESLSAHARWQDLMILQPLVVNGDKLDLYSALWSRPISKEITVHNINKYNTPDVLVYGSGTVYSIMGGGMSYAFWNAYTVTYDQAGGYYYVSSIDLSSNSKTGITLPADGFVLLLWRDSGMVWDIKVGERVDVPFSYKRGSVSNTSGFGMLSTIRSNNLTPIQAADTSALIEINLYNYGDQINSKYLDNGNYPGFQQANGTTTIDKTLTVGSFNFGDNITADQDAGISNVTTNERSGAINKVVNKANTPISKVMNYNLVNGYPTLAYTATNFDSTLWWLFSDNASTTTTKVNSSNINGLFLYDEQTGLYSFDSRVTTAQYNYTTGNFDLYSEAITPNYMMYPFGNFLPFNDINTQATKVTDIDESYYSLQSSAATAKYKNGAGDEYSTLATMLDKFAERMGTSFTYLDAVNKYFELAGLPTGGDASVFENMYNLDYSEASDFYFGMSMHTTFIMPKDGTTGPDGDTPLYFDFNGDDDVWVYVDGKLFLDLSGIHRHVGGRIDLQNGRVEYYKFNPATGEADISIDTGLTDENGNPYTYTKIVNGVEKTIYYVPFATFLGASAEGLIDPETGTFYEYTSHPFDFYYMERGSGSSVCKMEFALPLIQQNSISVTKAINSDDDLSVLGNPDFSFQILKSDGTTPLIGAGVRFTIMDADNQIEIGEGITGANGVFTIKAGQTAVFSGIDENAGQYFVRELLEVGVFEQYGAITVDGQSTTRDHYKTDITVGTGVFVGVDSDIKDISDGSTAFVFTNHIDIYKYGSLKLSKSYNDYQSGIAPRDVTFEISIGGAPIDVGAQYTVILTDGTEEIRYVTTEGEITFRSDETVYFPKVLAGTKVTLRESAESADGYDVTYTVTEGAEFETLTDSDGAYSEGVIPSGLVEVTVSNDREGTQVSVPVRKRLLYPDGASHTYTFVLQQIVGLNDLTPTGIYIKTPISIAEGEWDFEFKLNFVPGTPDGLYYYLIYEEGAEPGGGIDTARYIVEIAVTANGGTTNAVIIGRYSDDGTPIEGSDPITFENEVVRSLTVKKNVQGINTDAVFEFELRAHVSGVPINGTYVSEGTSSITSVEFIDGVARLSISHGEEITVLGLPYGTEWSVKEVNTDGYFTSYSINFADYVVGDTAQGILGESSTVTFQNAGGYELPSTGSSAHLWFTYAGWTIMILSLVIAYILRRRYERRRT